MRILIIRHGDPDYSIDSLTEKGWREAGLLAPRMLKEHITAFYASPLGRAQDTAKPTLDLYEKETGSRPEIKTLDWLHEFPARIDLDLTKCGAPEGTPTLHCPWNMPPQYWSRQPEFFTQEWRNHPMYMDKSCEVVPVFERVIKGWGDLMESHGYTRGAGSDGHPGYIYDVVPGTEKNQTIALFCHHGLGTSLIAAITGIPLPLCWKSFFLPTSSVTTVLMEENPAFPGHPQAHIIGVGDESHLYAGGEPISSSGLFCPIE